jgi:NitT/TauT family transport system substrate-binding protein
VNKNIAIAVMILVAIALGLCVSFFQDLQKNTEKPSESITVAYSPFESCALFLIAVDRGFFEENGLNLTLYRSDSGAAALGDMLSGKADMAVSVSEFPLIRMALQGTPARAVASMDKAEYIYIIARKDRGITNPYDLKGKRIGTAAGSIAEFYLGRFLTLQGLGMQDVRYVSVKTPPETSDAVVNGSLDAAVLAQPYADQARDRLGENAIVWPAQSSQLLYALVVSTEGWISEHPEGITRFLRALSQAEDYASSHPAEAQSIVQKRLSLNAEYMNTVWRQNQFSLSLDQSLILAMEDEGRWMIAINLTNATVIPNSRNYIYTKGLEEVRPESVNIIG